MGERWPTRPPRRSALTSPWWLIEKSEDGPMEVLTLECGGEEVLAAFGFREEAELFLQVEALNGEWQLRESGTGELVSLLYGPSAGAVYVALDPLPEMVAENTVGLVSLRKERFIAHFTTRERQPASIRIRNRDLEEISKLRGAREPVSLPPPTPG